MGSRAATLRRALRRDALAVVAAGLAAVEPGKLVRRALRWNRRRRELRAGRLRIIPGRIVLIAAGKAAIAMSAEASRILGADLSAGVVVAPAAATAAGPAGRHGRAHRLETHHASHPVPDSRGVTAGRAVLRLLRRLELRAEDLVLVLLSGGASALLPAPRRGVGFAAKRRITRSLLERGASIEETNAIRKQLSRLKGGGLLRLASPARVLTLAISDVPGDDPRVIGSGPGVAPNPADLTAARRAARRYLSGADRRLVLRLIENGKKTPGGRRGHALVIGSGRTFIEAAAREARVRGYRVRKRVNCLRGEARRMGPRLTRDHPDRERVATLWSGETVVTVRGRGIGGRNLEVALAAIPGLSRRGRPSVLVTVATDGCDGPSGASGALVDDVSHRSLRAASVRIAEALRSNDSRLALAAIGALRSTGPTGTNVGDIALMLG